MKRERSRRRRVILSPPTITSDCERCECDGDER